MLNDTGTSSHLKILCVNYSKQSTELKISTSQEFDGAHTHAHKQS